MLRRTRLVVAAGLALAALAGCGSNQGDDEADDGDKATSPSATPTTAEPYLEVPAGVSLTEPGAVLELGESGVVAFQKRQEEIGVLSVSVDRIERTSFTESFDGWNVNDVTAARTPYFVRATVTNLGDLDLGGYVVDSVLWAEDGENLEAPTAYASTLLPVCHADPLPTPFVKDATAEICLTYFIAPAHTLQGVSFQPFGGLDAITWSGELSPVTEPVKPGKKGGKKGDKSIETPSGTPSGTPGGTPSATSSASAS
ncbi:hypothetical protein ASE01_11765 [Nocardioides sp. Root190]|uniref:hypothetical protein n=1 Tax=Nocardioides sp. Root190 TaxID=1736488 RepID=UPI0006FBC4A1|nr:hypothetical protein [Nocardioides sp. Root190]KRB77387.1 hypothetical protein ASE01_11765 [Nocardioides sp. Root190]